MNEPAFDQHERDRISEDLGTTLFVEAGAGSGKTSALVNRVLALVTTGTAELRSIAAITFTEKAGAELRDRIRVELEKRAEATAGTEVAERCSTAITQLDGAAIGTLHAFAQRILSENPVEAGLPPRLEVLDEISSGAEFERRWAGFRDELLADPDLERTLILLIASGVQPEALRSLALAFDQNWDLVQERVEEDCPEPPRIRELLEPALAPIDVVCGLRDHCTDHTDKLCIRLDEIADYAEHLRSIEDEFDLLDALSGVGPRKAPGFRVGNLGRGGSWGIDHTDVRTRVSKANDLLTMVRDQVTEACAKRIGSALRGFTVGAAGQRRTAGQLAFHDLLVLARSLLRDPAQGAVVRERLHGRYRHLLLDEFQDTDPIQIELAVRIAAADPSSPEAGTALWNDVPVAPGHLFVVGDPKQSIYRFRRADISLYIKASERFGPEGGGVVELTSNFRSVAPVIDWVNATFTMLLAIEPEIEMPVPSQPVYRALRPVRPAPPVGPSVSLLGREELVGKWSASDIRTEEAGAVAATIARVVSEGWSVGGGGGSHTWRAATLGDITVLVPARTSLPFLEDALDEAHIPYRAESSSLVYSSRAVRDLLMVLRAADDPTNYLQVVSALRTPLLGCGDDDLFRFKVQRGGHWSYLTDLSESVPADDPVQSGLAFLRTLHANCRWLGPSELLGQIARDRRAYELGFGEGRPRDVWRRLRYVTDQARSWSDATGGSLRQYLQWVDSQTKEGARVAEAVLPETDDDAVRIMTIHAAKGLEFPITIVSGLSTKPQMRRAPAEVAFPPGGGVGYRFRNRVVTQEFADWKPIDEQMGFDERIRLLYVACTRASDHLVVSLYRKEGAPPAAAKQTNAALLHLGMGALFDTLPDAVEQAATTHRIEPVAPPSPPPPFAEWEAERRAALAATSRPSTVAATALTAESTPDAGRDSRTGGRTDGGTGGRDSLDGGTARDGGSVDVHRSIDVHGGVDDSTDANSGPGDGGGDAGLHKRPYDLDLPPWLKGRYGTAVGRAVHGVLQTIDLQSGGGLDDAVAAQCEAEAIPGRRADVRDLAEHALRSPVVRAAAAQPHWREVYACTPIAAGRLLEGYVDLLYRSAKGLVIVDYKTAATSAPARLATRAAGYRLQGGSYALAVGRATGESVVRVTFLFLTPNGPVEIDLTDLDDAMADVEALVVEGSETVVA